MDEKMCFIERFRRASAARSENYTLLAKFQGHFPPNLKIKCVTHKAEKVVESPRVSTQIPARAACVASVRTGSPWKPHTTIYRNRKVIIIEEQAVERRMWRESVYSGTLRPLTLDQTTGTQLDRLLDQLTYTRGLGDDSISSRHSINRIDAGLYLGDKYAAKDKKFLQAHGITHVLNCAEGTDEYQVDTNGCYYADAGIKYLGIPGQDRPSWNISVYFDLASRFIESAIRSGGSVLIHCVVGISRSATILIAYLMISRGMRAQDALRFVFRRRRVFPNAGFLHHLAQLDSVLMKRRTTQPYLTSPSSCISRATLRF